MKTKLGNESENHKTQFINWYPALKRYCRMITRSHWDGEDLAQETMIKVFKHYNTPESTDNVSLALMYRIAKNQWVDQIRKGSKESKETFGEPAYEPMKRLPEVLATIEMLMMNVTPQQAVIFVLKDVFQYSLSDIAEQLSLSEGAVKASLFRTRNRLKTCMNDDHLEIVNNPDDATTLLLDAMIEAIRAEKPELLLECFRVINKGVGNSSPSCSAGYDLQLRAA